MGYAQWLELKIRNHTSKTLRIKDLYLHHGKMYAYPDKSKTTSENTFNGRDIRPGETLSFATCGSENNWIGAEGNFSVCLKSSVKENADRICQVYWECPFSGLNKLSSYFIKEGWFINVPAVDLSGSIGNQTITIFTTADDPVPSQEPVSELKKVSKANSRIELKRSAASSETMDSAIAV